MTIEPHSKLSTSCFNVLQKTETSRKGKSRKNYFFISKFSDKFLSPQNEGAARSGGVLKLNSKSLKAIFQIREQTFSSQLFFRIKTTSENSNKIVSLVSSCKYLLLRLFLFRWNWNLYCNRLCKTFKCWLKFPICSLEIFWEEDKIETFVAIDFVKNLNAY